MKRGDGPNPGEEFLYKLATQSKFYQYLTDYRKIIGVPKDGIGEAKSWKEEWNRLISDSKVAFNILIAAEHIQTRFKIPVAYAPLLRFYICFGYIPKEFKGEMDILKICPPIRLLGPNDIDEEKELRTYFPYEPYAKLLIFGTSRKNDVARFLEKNWNEVEEILKKQGWTRPRKVRLTVNKKRNLRIKELNRKTIEELQKEADLDDWYYGDSQPRYKHLLIRKILMDEGYGEVDDGNIRKIAFGNK